MRVPLRKQLPVYSPISLGAIVTALRQRLSPGINPRESLVSLLKQRYQADAVSLFSSGTHALTAAIAQARAEHDGAPVALPAFSCYDVATAAVGADAQILLYDLDPDTLGPDWRSLSAAVEAGARVVVVAPLYGVPIDWDRVAALGDTYDVTVVEDAAQGAGGRWRGRRIGSLGELSVLSFGRGKGWTGGGGGALLARGMSARALPATPAAANAAEAVDAVKALAQWLLGRPSLYGLPSAIPQLRLGETDYHGPTPLQEMGAFNAALALATSEPAEAATADRAKAAGRLMTALDGHPDLHFPRLPADATSGWLRLPCRVTEPTLRRTLLRSMNRHGVESSYPGPLGSLEAVRSRLGRAVATPGADRLARELITLPTHGWLRPRDIELLTRQLDQPGDRRGAPAFQPRVVHAPSP